MSNQVPLRFLRKTLPTEKVLEVIVQRECEHLKVTPIHYPGDWNHDPDDFFVCDECGESFSTDPNDVIDLDEISPEAEAEIKQVCQR